jgi:hypothetical protein
LPGEFGESDYPAIDTAHLAHPIEKAWRVRKGGSQKTYRTMLANLSSRVGLPAFD